MSVKQVKFSYTAKERQWVGNGFHVHPLLRPSPQLNRHINPFILLDYGAPKHFTPTKTRRGVGEHPHRGFETVTFAYQGSVEHRDSSGGGGIIHAGDVQWMTAGSGVVHDEFHSAEFSQTGGIFEMVQMWVNLPKIHKMTKPKYQGIQSQDIPIVDVGKHTKLRILAGECQGVKGPASTFTVINMFDILGTHPDTLQIDLMTNTNTILLILNGEVVHQDQEYPTHSILIFDRGGTDLTFDTSENFKGLLLNGEPIDEPIVAHGPFVMNTREEIMQAMVDYQNGKMGRL
ncbi:MAG: pirin family protein [Myxococcota bacterium]